MGRPGRDTIKRGLTINDPAKEAAEAGLLYATDAELGTVCRRATSRIARAA